MRKLVKQTIVPNFIDYNKSKAVSLSDYYAFGSQMPGRLYNSANYRYGMNGQEIDNEVSGNGNVYSAKYWEYDSRLGKRWNPDPVILSDLSSFAVFANNPILYTDVLGNTFTVGTNSQSQKDITSLAKKENQNYINIDQKSGSVTLNFGEISAKQKEELLSNDAGLKLINDMCGSDKKFYYEATEAREIIGGDVKGVWFAAKDENGVLNASNNGKDSGNSNNYKSANGYDGEVLTSIKGTWSDVDNRGIITNIEKPRSAIIFHELSENYERTHNGIDYYGSKKFPFGAHSLANKREVTWWNKSLHPGGYAAYKNPDSKLTKVELYKLYYPEKFNKSE